MTINTDIDTELLKELPAFESFFNRMGFKRIDGSIYGLLVLSEGPLASEDIQKSLSVSQSATSMSLKTLLHFGAIESIDCRERRCKVHTAKEDSLSIVASICRKREQENIENFKLMAKKILAKEPTKETKRAQRLQSIITTCEMAESIINFLISLSHGQLQKHYKQISKRLPQVLEMLSTGPETLTKTTVNLTSNITNKIKDGFLKFTGDM